MEQVKETTEYENFVGKKIEIEQPTNLFDALGIEVENEQDPNCKEHDLLWKGMPEFEQKTKSPYKTIFFHFRNEEDFMEFCEKYKKLDEEQFISEKTKTIWYPHLEKEDNFSLRWIEEQDD